MAESKRKGRGCFKLGCFGCLALVAVPVLLAGMLFAVMHFRGPHEPQMERRELTQDVPVAESAPAQPAPGEESPPGTPPAEVALNEPGRVIINVEPFGRFLIEPGPPGAPIRVEADYDVSAFSLEQTYEASGETGWIYRLDFHRTASWLSLLGFNDSDDNEIRLILPRDTPISIEGSVGLGVSDIELGGLWLVGADLEVGMGDHFINFDKPLPVPSGPLRFKGTRGSLRVARVGNASPPSLDLEHSMGDVELDLRGPWVRDARIDARCGMGSCRIRLPEGVHLDLQKVTVSMGDKNLRGLRDLPPPPQNAPTLTLSLSSRMGDLRVER